MNYEALSQVTALLAVFGQNVPDQASVAMSSVEKIRVCTEQAAAIKSDAGTKSRVILNFNEFMNDCIKSK